MEPPPGLSSFTGALQDTSCAPFPPGISLLSAERPALGRSREQKVSSLHHQGRSQPWQHPSHVLSCRRSLIKVIQGQIQPARGEGLVEKTLGRALKSQVVVTTNKMI